MGKLQGDYETHSEWLERQKGKPKRRRKRPPKKRKIHFVKRHAPVIMAIGMWLIPSPLSKV